MSILAKHIRAATLLVGLATAAVLLRDAAAAKPPPVPASAGLDLVREAARAWSADAALVYVENDEDLDALGASPRWSYLFQSPALGELRFYSVREGRIEVAENLHLQFEAPPLSGTWIDSGEALDAAERDAGSEFRRQEGGRLSTMLLMRGAFQDKDPDQTTWTVVYTAPGKPSLFVMVDAAAGKVRRTWRG